MSAHMRRHCQVRRGAGYPQICKGGRVRAREEASMDLTYTAAEEEFRRELRSWLQANIPEEWTRPGFWESLDADESFRLRRDWERGKADAGFAGIAWPTEYGGRGGTPGMKAIYDEEMVLADAPRTVNGLGLAFLAPTVMAIGTDAQKKEIIGPLLRNEVIWCQGFSEPGAGSDLAAVAARGVRDGDDFVVNGQKVWTTNAVHGDKIFTLVRTEPGSQRHRGLSMLLVDMHQPGVDARPLKQMSGASEFGEVFFDDARVPATECLGEIGDGWAPPCCCSRSSAARPGSRSTPSSPASTPRSSRWRGRRAADRAAWSRT